MKTLLEQPKTKEAEFASLVAQIVPQVLAHLTRVNLENYFGEEKEDKTSFTNQVSNILGHERGERMQNLNEIDRIFRNTNVETIIRDPRLEFQFPFKQKPKFLKDRNITSTLENEELIIIRKLRKDRQGFVESKIAKDYRGIYNRIKDSENSFQEIDEEYIKENFHLLVKYLDGCFFSEEVSEEKAYEFYTNGGYLLLAPVNEHNNEVKIFKNNQVQNNIVEETEEDFETILKPPQTEESAVKTSHSSGVKSTIYQDPNKISDFYRNTILIDPLFDNIDLDKIRIKANKTWHKDKSVSKKELHESFLKEERIKIFSIYLNQKLDDLRSAGFKLDENSVSIKAFASGYSDATIKVKKFANGEFQEYEIQLQTESTLKNKKKETPENDLRKRLINTVYISGENIFKELKSKTPFEIKKFIEKLLVKKIENPENIKNELLQAIEEFCQEKCDLSEVGEFLESIIENQKLMQESLKRSQIWYKQASFISKEKDIELLKSYIDSKNIPLLDLKVSQALDLNGVEPNFEKHTIPSVKIITFVRNSKGEIKILLGKKSENARGAGNLTMIGGKDPILNNLLPVTSSENIQDNRTLIDFVALEELRTTLSNNSQNLDIRILPFPDGREHPYSHPNPDPNESIPTQVFSRCVCVEVNNFDDLELNTTEKFEGDGVFLDPEEFFRTLIVGNFDGQNYNGNITQMPLGLVSQLWDLYYGGEFHSFKATRINVFRKNLKTGQKEYLYLKVGVPKKGKIKNLLPEKFEDWEDIPLKDKLILVANPTMISYLGKQENYENYVTSSREVLKCLEERKKAHFSTLKNMKNEILGGKVEEDNLREATKKEFFEETGLKSRLEKLIEDKEKPSENINDGILKLTEIIKKLENYFDFYKNEDIDAKNLAYKEKKETYWTAYFNLDLDEVLGDLAPYFSEFISLDSTKDSNGFSEDNQIGYNWLTGEELIKLTKTENNDFNFMNQDGSFVDHSDPRLVGII